MAKKRITSLKDLFVDLSDPKEYEKFIRKYAADITPGIEGVDEHQRKSKEKMFRVVRGYT